MSKTYPECPLYNHNNCKELHNRKVCAIVREDKICLKKLPKSVKRAKPSSICWKGQRDGVEKRIEERGNRRAEVGSLRSGRKKKARQPEVLNRILQSLLATMCHFCNILDSLG